MSRNLHTNLQLIRQDSGLNDLARKFNVTLEAIALQTRHIVDQMNAKGHLIRSIYMSGGQAKNAPLMQLFANTCNMPVVLPQNSGAAVVLGAAMLGRFAGEAQGDTKKLAIENRGEALWDIMVSTALSQIPVNGATALGSSVLARCDMTGC